MERLGHSSIQVTLDRYGHLLPSLDETLTDGLEATSRTSLTARADARRDRPWLGCGDAPQPGRHRPASSEGGEHR